MWVLSRAVEVVGKSSDLVIPVMMIPSSANARPAPYSSSVPPTNVANVMFVAVGLSLTTNASLLIGVTLPMGSKEPFVVGNCAEVVSPAT